MNGGVAQDFCTVVYIKVISDITTIPDTFSKIR